MISLSSINADPIGYVSFQEAVGTNMLVHERRMTRTATLDGLSVISDMGYTTSDNTFLIKLDNVSQSVIDRIIYLIKIYPIVKICTKDGVFIGAINNLKHQKNPVEFQFFVKEKTS